MIAVDLFAGAGGFSTCLVFPLMDSAKQVLRDMWNRRSVPDNKTPNDQANRPLPATEVK